MTEKSKKNKIEENQIEENIKKIEKKFKSSLDLIEIEEIMKSNEFEFEFRGVKYKVKKPTFGQKQETQSKKTEKEIELIQIKDDNDNYKYKSREELIKIYKDRGIDIDELDSTFVSLERKKNDLQIKLGKGLKEKKSKKELELYHDEIEKIDILQQEVSIKKAQLLISSTENQLEIFIYSYLTYLIAEKLVEDKWVKVWSSYDEFQKTSGAIVDKISYYTVLIVQNEV